MPELRFALLGEGNSDDALLPLIQKTLEEPSLGLLPSVDLIPVWAERHQLSRAHAGAALFISSIELFPCDLLFVHLDADGPNRTIRTVEINTVASEARRQMGSFPPVVPVVPVRTMEAWFLVDETAVRRAAGKPHGSNPLNLPRGRQIESTADPKGTLRQALRTASELPRRRWHEVDDIRPRDIASFIDDLASLRALPAFQAFEAEVQRVIEEQGWPARLG